MTIDLNDPDLPKPTKRTAEAYTDEQIAKALIANRGLQYLAADALGMNYSHLSVRIGESEYLKNIKVQCVQKRLDVAEKGLSELTEEKELGAICFFLKTIGKSRGYVESNHITVDPQTLKQHQQLMDQLQATQEALKIKESKESAE